MDMPWTYILHRVLFKSEAETLERRVETCRIGTGTMQEVSKEGENQGKINLGNSKAYLHEQTTARQIQVFRNGMEKR